MAENDKIIPFPGANAEKPSADLVPYLQKLQSMEQMFVIFSAATRQPFLVCEEENFHDQIWIYEREEDAKKRVEELTSEAHKVMLVTVQNKDFLGFYSSLYTIGIDTVVLFAAPTEGEEISTGKELELTSIVIKRDYENLPENQRPVLNPQVQLTGLYFMQEFHRGVDRSMKPKLVELEEEAVSALAKARLLLPVRQNEDKTISAPFVKGPNDDHFQPIFTDLMELRKYDVKGEMKILAIPFAEIENAILPTVKGIVVNPNGICMAVNKERIKALKERFL